MTDWVASRCNIFLVFAILAAAVLAAAASPSPSPSPPAFHTSVDSYVDFIDTSSHGPGIAPPEGNAFAHGSTLSPNTPYDVWSSAPLTPGIAGIGSLGITEQYTGARYDASATIGSALVTGSMQNAVYWGENLMPAINPHLGYTALPYAITFPTHAAEDDASASAIAPLFASFGSRDGAWQLRGGFFDLNQNDKFVFMQPLLTNVTPNIGLQTAESLGNGPPALDSWPSPPVGLPLHGVDFTAHHGLASLELANAALPSLPGDTARASIGSLVFDRGEGTRYSFSYVHVATGGTPIVTTTFYGADPHATPGPQGNLQTSTLGGQMETIAGVRAAFHVAPLVDSVVEVGRTWYDASDVFRPGTNRPGGFYHAGFSHKQRRITIGVDGYRFEARYANAILPYGTPENIWSAPWAWPGVWLKSTYQLVDNLQAPGSNRQGYRVHYSVDGGPLEFHAAFSTFHQIDPSSYENMQQVGFVDGFFLPQLNGAATLGEEHQYNAWIAWHPAFGDITLDYADDQMHRDAAPGHPEDAVAFQTPQIVLTLAHVFSKSAIADAGFGQYAMKGTWAQPFTNVDYFENVLFAGTQLAESPHASVLIQLRRTHFAGLPALPAGASPSFNATMLIFEQLVHF